MPSSIVFIILPFSILTAHGLKYILEKWYGLFPENPYARVAAILPLTLLFSVMILPSLLQYIYGYRYSPSVATQFNYDLPIISKNLTDEALLVKDHYDFYKILEDSTDIKVISDIDGPAYPKLAVLRGQDDTGKYNLSLIITSPMAEESDIIYLYTAKGE